MKISFRALFLIAFLFPTLALAAKPNLDGINYEAKNPSESIAIIDGELLRVGQKSGGYEVMNIELTKVHLKDEQSGEEFILDMNQEFKSFKRATTEGGKKAAAEGSQKKSFKFFEGFQNKAQSQEKTKEVKAAKHVNMWDSISTSVQAVMPGAGPLADYKKFIDHLFRGEFDKAKLYAAPGSPAAASVDNKVKSWSVCIAENGKRFTAASYKIESEKKDDKKAEIVVIQTVRGDPPGTTSAFGAASVIYKHRAILSRTDKGWKVQSFSYQAQTKANELGNFWLCID